jgi:hypothetical protein
MPNYITCVDAQRIINEAGGQCFSTDSNSKGGIAYWLKGEAFTEDVRTAIKMLAGNGWRIDYVDLIATDTAPPDTRKPRSLKVKK